MEVRTRVAPVAVRGMAESLKSGVWRRGCVGCAERAWW
jgi:hypothetical protein